MATLDFSTRNNTATGVSWHVGKRGGVQAIAVTEPGICCAMSAVWIKKSLAAGPGGLTDRQELGSQHSIAIVAGAFFIGSIPGTEAGTNAAMGKGLLAAQGLGVGLHEFGTPCDPFNVAMRLSFVNGYAFLGLMGSGGGHAMAVRVENGVHKFFDPNEGQIDCADVNELRVVAQDIIESYDDLHDGQWDIFHIQ